MIEKLKDPKIRKYIYQVISALIPVLIVFGVMVPGQSELILALVAALLGLGVVGHEVLDTRHGLR